MTHTPPGRESTAAVLGGELRQRPVEPGQSQRLPR
jgi:hypothetical protein